MSVNWITVAAQVVNFLVLIWLLKRFLYRPILDGIDAREAEIKLRMGEAATIRAAAEAKEAEYEAEIASLRASRAGMLEEARRAAEAERAGVLADARETLARQQAEREAQRTEEARRFTADLQRRGAEALLLLARKAVADLADEGFEQRIVEHALARLKGMEGAIREAAGASPEAVVLSRDPLPDELQASLREGLAAILPGAAPGFRTDPALSPGLSLRVGGAQVSWTIESYFDGLEQLLEDRIGRTGVKGLTDAA